MSSSGRPTSKSWIQDVMRRIWHKDLQGLLWWTDPARPYGEDTYFVDMGELGYKLHTKFTSWAFSFIAKHIKTEPRRREVRQALSRCWGTLRDTRKRSRVVQYKPDIEAGSPKGRCLFLVLADKGATLQVINETLPKWVS